MIGGYPVCLMWSGGGGGGGGGEGGGGGGGGGGGERSEVMGGDLNRGQEWI